MCQDGIIPFFKFAYKAVVGIHKQGLKSLGINCLSWGLGQYSLGLASNHLVKINTKRSF